MPNINKAFILNYKQETETKTSCFILYNAWVFFSVKEFNKITFFLDSFQTTLTDLNYIILVYSLTKVSNINISNSSVDLTMLQ